MPKITPMKAIRRFCLECAGGHVGVRNCDDKDCALRVFRFGMGLKRYLSKKRYSDSKKTHFIHNENKLGEMR